MSTFNKMLPYFNYISYHYLENHFKEIENNLEVNISKI